MLLGVVVLDVVLVDVLGDGNVVEAFAVALLKNVVPEGVGFSHVEIV